MHVTFFVVKYSKHSDENIVNIALITFCSLAVTKLANWQMSSLRSCGVGLSDSLLQLSFVLAFFDRIQFKKVLQVP